MDVLHGFVGVQCNAYRKSKKKMSEERPKPATGYIFREVSLFSSSRYPSLVTNISGMLTISFSYKILIANWPSSLSNLHIFCRSALI